MAQDPLPRRTRQDLQSRAVREILRATAEALPLNEILSVIANVTIIVFDATTSWFMLAKDGHLRTVLSRGELAEELMDKECPLGTSNTCVAALGETAVVLQPREIDPGDSVIGGLTTSSESERRFRPRAPGRPAVSERAGDVA
jgi:hypothetical protein